jgi:ribosome recycling factor
MTLIDSGREMMNEVIDGFNDRLGTLRTGRANASMLYGIEIDYYGTPTPIEQLSQISVSEGTQLTIKLFDPSALKDVERALNESHLDLPIMNDGTLIRINVPGLTEETRKNIVKDVSKFAEEFKVQIRNIRRDLNQEVKDDDALREDDEKRALENVQKLTDEFIKKIDDISKAKTEEIMTV